MTLEPASRCCWDEPVRIVVRGLAPEQPVTMRASLRDEKGALFQAHACYCADTGGELDLMRAPALGGSFTGLEPMGLIWALEPEKPLFRLVKRDVQTPFVVELEVLEGHQPEGGRLLGQAVHERDFLAPGVRRVPVRAGRVRATLFLPPGERSASSATLESQVESETLCGLLSGLGPRDCGTYLNWSPRSRVYRGFWVEDFFKFHGISWRPCHSLSCMLKSAYNAYLLR